MIRFSMCKAFVLGLLLSAGAARAEDSAWVSLLNGKDLRDWTPYFQKGPGNPDSTYKVTPEGWLYVDIHISFNTTGFGHIFYTKRKYSYYMIRSVYRFPTATFGPDWGQGWNMQNNGLMVHSQDPATMKGKDFPNSIEVQLLGPKNQTEAATADWLSGHTANLCTPGTFVAYNGNANYTQHCTTSQYPDAWKKKMTPFEDPDGWSDITVRVLADSLMQHFVHSTKVFEYTKIRLDNGTPLKEGYLSVQAEGTSTQFKTLEVLDLEGCMDKTKSAYRTYFVKSNPAACVGTGVKEEPARPDFSLARVGSDLVVRGGIFAEVRRADGSGVALPIGATTFRPARSGVYLVTVRSAAGTFTRKTAWF